MKKIMLLLMVTVVMAGCVPPEVSPEVKRLNTLLAARRGYNATMVLIIEKAQAGRYTDVQMERIEIVRATAWIALDEWQAAEQAGKPTGEIITVFRKTLTRLRREMRTE